MELTTRPVPPAEMQTDAPSMLDQAPQSREEEAARQMQISLALAQREAGARFRKMFN
jgi:hypothetical protein